MRKKTQKTISKMRHKNAKNRYTKSKKTAKKSNRKSQDTFLGLGIFSIKITLFENYGLQNQVFIS